MLLFKPSGSSLDAHSLKPPPCLDAASTGPVNGRVLCPKRSSVLARKLGFCPMPLTNPSLNQWLFPVSALRLMPTVASGYATLDRELYDRSRGVEFLYRLGSSLGLSVSYTRGFLHPLSEELKRN